MTAAACEAKAKKPNFVIIFTDDQGYGDLSCYDASDLKTPNIDQMAEEGIRFTDFYVPATVCTPSRAGLLTGSYPKRVGLHNAVLFPYSAEGLNPAELTIADCLKPLGYRTACIGKWHLGHHPEFMPNRQGFDYFYGVPYSNDMDGHYYKHIGFQSPPLPLYENEKKIEDGPDQNYLTKRYTEAACRFIRESGDEPFFLYVPHNMPHLPLHVSPEFRGTSERGLYGDVIQEIDWSVGEIRRTLKKAGVEDNTLVIFTSDNGPVIKGNELGSAGPLRGEKATTWEGGARVPCVMTWPGQLPEGKECSTMLSTMDLLPTLVHFAGGTPPTERKLDGHDIGETLLNPEGATSPYNALYIYARNGRLETMRTGNWKLHTEKCIGWNGDGEFPISLYNLKDDIGESTNLAETNPELVHELLAQFNDFDCQLTRDARPVGRITP